MGRARWPVTTASRGIGALMLAICMSGCVVATPVSGPSAGIRQHLLDATDLHCVRGDETAALRENTSPVKRRGRVVGFRYSRPTPTGRVDVERFGRPNQLRGMHISLIDNRNAPVARVVVDGDCSIQRGSFVENDASGEALHVIMLDASLQPRGDPVPINPPMPRSEPANEASQRVRVGLLDSGVDYRQPWVSAALAYDANGRAIGWDFHDNENRPFDSDPAASIYAPRRHGTRVASVIIEEAPNALLVPYRYPRSNAGALAAVVKRAAADGVRILNISLGSRDRAQWEAFGQAMSKAPMLAVVSAGNDGSNLDDRPLYPASLNLDNVLVVTSANKDGSVARGSATGPNTVDLLVAGEELITRRFGGGVRMSSGSSFAAARISAFAACLLARSPGLMPVALKNRVLAMAQTPAPDMVNAGFLDLDSSTSECPPRVAIEVDAEQKKITLPEASAERMSVSKDRSMLNLSVDIFRVAHAEWSPARVSRVMRDVAKVLAQCRVRLSQYSVRDVAAPLRRRQIEESSMRLLAKRSRENDDAVLRVFLMQDTLREIEFGAEAIGRVNARRRPALRDTVWITSWSPHTGTSLAHELVHVLADSGIHRNEPDNLMSERTTSDTRLLTEAQCGQIRNIGLGNRLLQRP